jgi:uncharacterized protein (DUF1800 family)
MNWTTNVNGTILITLGVDRFTEQDVKEMSRVLTGYHVARSSGEVKIDPSRQDRNPVTIFGQNMTITSQALVELLVERKECQQFIPERIWYRFISSTEKMPENFAAIKAFSDRNIAKAVSAIINSSVMADLKYEMVKSPVEWFVAACRALEIIPSKLVTSDKLINYLGKLGQVPFAPPNVGGWTAGGGWLSSASALSRVEFAKWLVPQSDLRVITEMPISDRTRKSANWLGIPDWSPRTKAVLEETSADPVQFVLMALCSPEYIVSR